jgi:dihydrofolate synthase/folylpolyglutamate synthase
MNHDLTGIQYINSLTEWTGTEKFDLNTVRELCRSLGMPQDLVPSIHVAGTNGKGSTSAVISSILGASGYNVGLNISPHLEDIMERFVINGYKADISELNYSAQELKKVASLVGLSPTFHEAVTVCAFLMFKNLDWAVYEVGLGGRLDASNVLSNPRVSVITNINYDHQLILGDTLSKIATEKAGIIKQNGTVVLGKIDREPNQAILEIANSNNAKVYQYEKDFIVTSKNELLSYKDSEVEFDFHTNLQGNYQHNNIGVAIKAARLAGVSVENCISGVANAFWPGRLEKIVYRDKSIWLDCAHNIGGIRALKEFSSNKELNHLILLGILQRPDWQTICDEVSAYWKNVFCLTPNSKRAIPSKELCDYLSCSEVKVRDFNSSYMDAINVALNESPSDIIITGSLYLIGEIRKLLNVEPRPLWIKA